MAEHPNVSVVRRFYQAFIARDTARLYQLAGEKMGFHIAGRSQFSGLFTGRDQILKVFHDTGVATDRSLHIEPHAVAGDDQHVVGLHHISASRAGKAPLDQNGCLVCHVDGAVITDAWLLWEDLRAADAFWG
ncbi:MAG TPA: nuclear transport factor 2 family protein [Actinomycetota bacterium]|nr:nuclear transport factor 2 family protein [Actinomycetota bacterium]